MSKKHVEELTNWIKQSGIKLHENLSIVKVQKSYQLVASKPIDESETLISYPDKTIICLDTSDFSEIQFSAKQNELLAEEVSPYLAQTLIFLYEFLKPECSIKFDKGPSRKKKKKNQKAAANAPVKGRKSSWGEYLQHISQLEDLPTPASWSQADRELLKGTSLEERVAEMDEGLKEEFQDIIVPFLTDSSISCPQEKLSFEVYKKIRSYVLAYSWATGGDELTYSPLAELLGYSSHDDRVNGAIDLSDEDVIRIVSTKQLKANEQVTCTSSGARSAETIYKLGYIDHQPTEKYPVGTADDLVEIAPEFIFELLEKTKDEELLAARTQLLAELGLLEDVFEIAANGQLSNDLLLAIKLIFMDNQEFELYESEMKKSGFLFGEDDLEDLDDEEAAALEAEFAGDSDDEESIPKTLANPNAEKKQKGKEQGAKADKTKDSEGEEEDDDIDIPEGALNFSDVQEEQLPAITNEKGVYEFLETVLQQKLDLCKVTTSLVDYQKPGVIRKPQLLAEYLKNLEHTILQKALDKVRENIKSLDGTTSNVGAPAAGKVESAKKTQESPKKALESPKKAQEQPKKNNKKRANDKNSAPPAKKSKK